VSTQFNLTLHAQLRRKAGARIAGLAGHTRWKQCQCQKLDFGHVET